jgi:hypothetical protein
VSARYEKILDYLLGVSLWVDFRTERGVVVGYTVILLLSTSEGSRTIRVYDSTHGYNEMHRHTRTGGKQTGRLFHSGSLGEGLRVAIEDAEDRYVEMIEGWER